MGRVVYTGGTFDLFHAGHVNFLRQCKEIAGKDWSLDLGRVVVALNTDEFIEEYKGKPPVYSYAERRDILQACRYVDFVYPNTGGADSKPAIEVIKPNIIVVGSDWACKDYYAQMQFTQEWLDQKRIVLAYVPYTQGISTTELKRRIIKE
jgi:glycerol-3-phosphate cytidylyltransferase